MPIYDEDSQGKGRPDREEGAEAVDVTNADDAIGAESIDGESGGEK